MSVTYLTGRYEDGSTPEAGVELPAQTVLRLTKGRDHTIRLRLLTSAGSPVPFAGLTSVTLTAKTSTSTTVKSLQVAATAALSIGAEWCTFAITVASLKNLETTRYVYDIALVNAAGTSSVISTSSLILSPSVG